MFKESMTMSLNCFSMNPMKLPDRMKMKTLCKMLILILSCLFLVNVCFCQSVATSVDVIGSFGGIVSSDNYQEFGTVGQSTAIGRSQSAIYGNEAGFIYLLHNAFALLDQEIPLTNGWNIFSLRITPDNPAMMDILQPLIDEGSLVKVQNETGAAIEQIPGLGTWIDDIHNWSSTEGYKIRVNASTTLTVTGQPITVPVDISLLAGWNIMGYPSPNSQVAMTVLDGLITAGNLMKVQDETGAAIEPLPLNMGWIDDIHNFMPGEGYKVRVASDDVLTIDPSGTGGGLKSAEGMQLPQHFRPSWSGNGYDHMNIYLTEMTEGASALQAGDEIAVYDGEICVGSAVIQNWNQNLFAIAVSADDPITAETDGFVKGHTMSFRIWRSGVNSETTVNTVRFFPGYSNTFEPLGTTVAGVDIPVTGMPELVTSLGDNYPNPFYLETIFEFTVGETAQVNIALYNLLGETLKILVSQTMESGAYSTVWNATDQRGNKVPPGIYLCKMISGHYTAVRKVEVKQ
jgi:hypothetical protein